MIDMIMNIIISIIAAMIVMIVHELSKYYFSLSIVHPIHRKRMDLKINPLQYIDPVGLILFVFSGVGWQKPGEYNPNRFKDKEKSLLVLTLVGMAANVILLLAMIPIFIYFKTAPTEVGSYLAVFFYKLIRFSFTIIVINLLPMPPFDMAKIIYSINIEFYFKLIQNERIIQAVFILLIAFNIISVFVEVMFEPIQNFLF